MQKTNLLPIYESMKVVMKGPIIASNGSIALNQVVANFFIPQTSLKNGIIGEGKPTVYPKFIDPVIMINPYIISLRQKLTIM